MKKKQFILTLLSTVVLISESMAQVPSYVSTNGLIGWWPFNGNAIDESINTNDGAVNGAILTTDRYGNSNSAYSFDGIDDYINCGNIVTMNGQSELTIAAWVNANSNVFYSRIVGKEENNNGVEGFDLQFESANGLMIATNVRTGGGAGGQTTNSISLSTWVHIAVVFNGNALSNSDRLKIYFDGQEQILTFTNTIPAFTSTNNFECWIGGIYNVNNESPWHGKLDDIGIWNRAITLCEIQDLYNSKLNSASGIIAGNDVTVCEGDQVTLAGSGGSNYQWTNGIIDNTSFTANATLDYILTGETSNSCLGMDTVSVFVNPLPNVDAGNNLTVCEGDQVILNGSGADSYSWDNSVFDGVPFSASSTQTYTVTGIDNNNCENTDQVTVTVNAHSSSILNETGVDSVNVNGIWYTQSGQYSQIIQNAEGCDSTITINVSLTFTGINELMDQTILIYPNPTQSFINLKIDLENKNSSYLIYDSSGKTILSGTISSENTTIDVNNLSEGIYLITIGESLRQKFNIIKK